MRAAGAAIVKQLMPGDAVLLFGALGAGKTTFVRGMLEGLGYAGPVRSPTFNLLQPFPTDPPILHADLYRVESGNGLGIEDYLDTHVIVVEWAERLGDLIWLEQAYRVRIEFVDGGRRVSIDTPAA